MGSTDPRSELSETGSTTVIEGNPGERLVADPARFSAGERVGRYTILEPIGEGGMGIVFAAYDPELDRKVALKLLRSDLTPLFGGTRARARLIHEAQAMARLRHPNVVTVFEVGEHEHQVFLAMEYVAGGTLSQWAAPWREHKDGWQRIVAAYVQAGRGLAAAHEAGMVHRDFKPTNVLVEGDRIQVTDFGIAQRDDTADVAESAPAAPSEPLPPLHTDTGTLMGTAAYMAPERHSGAPADTLSDQFAFCVSLFEALYGRRPFEGKTRQAVADSITKGTIVEPEDKNHVPAWLDKALRRGLSRHRDNRWPSMGALLETLDSPEAADVGRVARIVSGLVLGLAFTLLPAVNAAYAFPFDTSTYQGAVQQTVALLGVFAVLTYALRGQLRATAFNRKVFAALLTMLLLQIPFEIGHAVAGVPIETSWVLHLFFWTSLATMFSVLVDLRFLVLAACYFTAFIASSIRPDLYGVISSINNIAFVACGTLISRRFKHARVR